MYNYNRDVYQAEHERAHRMSSAASKKVPYHLRSDRRKRLGGWLAANAFRPAGDVVSVVARSVTYNGGRYWRRSSSRLLGLIVNGLNEVVLKRA